MIRYLLSPDLRSAIRSYFAVQLCIAFCTTAGDAASSFPDVASRSYAVHDAGLQWLAMSNDGELGNPHGEILWLPQLEYPGGSGTVFLFSGGLWIGATVNGQPHVSTCTDGDNGTNEWGALELATPTDRADSTVRSVSWLERRRDADPGAREEGRHHGRYLGVGSLGVDDDGDGRVDEDPAGDISADFLDNDGDGLIDANDPDRDGDLVPGSCDDDGDRLVDEDDAALGAQELLTVMVDTCAACVENPGGDHWPLGLTVTQHSLQWSGPHADDIIIIRYAITNSGEHLLEDVCLATFFDFDVGHVAHDLARRSEDDLTYFFDETHMAIGADDDGDDGLLSSRACGVRFIDSPVPDPQTTYKNFNRLTGGDPRDDPANYALMSCGARDPDVSLRERGDWRMMLAIGPLGDLAPGGSITAAVALVNGFDDEHIRYGGITAEALLDTAFAGPTPPDEPMFRLEPRNRLVRVLWSSNAERAIERAIGREDFQGYNVWRTVGAEPWTLVTTYDLPDSIGLTMGWPPPANDDPESVREFAYAIVDEGLMNGARFRYVVTAFDDGNNGDGIHHETFDVQHGLIGTLESSLDGAREAVPAEESQAEGTLDSLHVVPDPYVGSCRLESGVESHLVEFRGLPPSCRIQIFTLAGDFVRELWHSNGLSWEPWDLRNRRGREVAGGVYVYRVSAGGRERIGRLLIVR